MLDRVILKVCNALLRQQSWAAEALRAHAGKGAELVIAGQVLRCLVTEQGGLESLSQTAMPAVRIELPAAALMDLSGGASALTQHALVSGEAAFAETLSRLLAHLRPELGAVLEPIVGPIVAHRIERGAQQALASAQDLGTRVWGNVQDYVREAQGPVVSRQESQALREEIAALEGQLAVLARRLS